MALTGKTISQLDEATLATLREYSKPYYVYTALVTQSGTTNPFPVELENTLGDIEWIRISGGTYLVINHDNSFIPYNTITIYDKLFQIDGEIYEINSSVLNTSQVSVLTSKLNLTGTTLMDTLLDETLFEIRSYSIVPPVTPSPTPSTTPSPTPSITPTITPSISVTPSVTPSITVSPSVTPSITVSPSVTPSITVSPSITPTVTPSISITPTITPTPSITPSVTPTITPTPSITPSVTPSISVSPTPSITPTITPSISVTPTVTPSISVTPSITPSSIPSRLEFDIGNMDPYDNPSEACTYGITDENVFLQVGDFSPTVGDILYENLYGSEPYFGNGSSYYYLTNGVDSWACKINGTGLITEITTCP